MDCCSMVGRRSCRKKERYKDKMMAARQSGGDAWEADCNLFYYRSSVAISVGEGTLQVET